MGLVSKKAEGTAYSWAEVEKLQKDLLGEWSDMWSDAKIKAEKERQIERERKKQLEYQKAYQDFKDNLTLKGEGSTNPALNAGFTGKCPCDVQTLTYKRITFKIYQDKIKRWWNNVGEFNNRNDNGPFEDKEDLLQFIFNNNFKPE